MKLGWRFQQALMTAGPWASFVATLGLAAWIHFDGGPGANRVVGFAQTVQASVATVEIGRIASIAVEPGQEVAAGDILVTLDTSALDAEIALVEAQKARIETMIPATKAETEQRLDESVERIERELAREQDEYFRAQAEQKELERERARAKELVDQKLAIDDEVRRIDVRYAAVKPLVDSKPRQIEILRKQLTAAQKRKQKAFDPATGSSAEREQNGDLVIAQRELEQLRQKRSELILRAPTSGRIAQVLRRAGEVVAAGEFIVSMVSTPGRVVACVPEKQALRMGAGDRATLWVRNARGASLAGRVASVGPLVTELPLRCWRAPNQPAWGREATIVLDQPVELLAGQAFDVDIDHTGAPPATLTTPATTPTPAPVPTASPAAAPGANAAAGKPALMSIPDAARRLSRIEPSGIVFRPELSRYVIVSDDTGQQDAGEKSPWLFTMSSSGAMDPEPITIAGVREVNDLESITAGDGGEMYVLSAQGYSKKGKRPTSRTAFLRLVPEGRGFRADAEAHLAEMLEAAGDEAMARLGLDGGTRNLEIEGMAFHKGSIYLGLKSPLDAQGNALIWKLSDPKAFFASKTLDAANLSVHARARLDAEVDGRSVPGGISELLFLTDGSLLITSTSSKVEGTSESGRLWHAPAPAAGTLTPNMVKTFPGLKPEGLCLSATPGKIVVVFDAGSATPSWMEMSWPQ